MSAIRVRFNHAYATATARYAAMNKYGPTRSELWFRLGFSIAGLVLVAGAVAFRGVSGIAAVEVVRIASCFFGGTAIWSAIRLSESK